MQVTSSRVREVGRGEVKLEGILAQLCLQVFFVFVAICLLHTWLTEALQKSNFKFCIFFVA